MKRYTDLADRQVILELRKEGLTYQAIAEETGWKYETVRKVCRAGTSITLHSLGRPVKGLLSSFSPLVRFASLRIKLQHPGWGPDVVIAELGKCDWDKRVKLPSSSQLGAYFSQFGDDLVKPRRHLQLPKSDHRKITKPGAHVCWQIDVQERIELADYGLANLLDIVDWYTGIKIGFFLFPALQGKRRCKVNLDQYREALRTSFERWGLPDNIRTDRERVLVPEGNYPYPSVFTLWLAGLGIEHQLIQRVTENGSVERSHRTRFERLDGYGPFAQLDDWQAIADYECWRMNAVLPSRGRNCQRKPPLLVYPQASQPRRLYRKADELNIFDLEKVKAYLSQGKWLRHTSSKGQFSFHVEKYNLGVPFQRRWIQVIYSAQNGFLVTCPPANDIILRFHLTDLSSQAITGLLQKV